jgi:hypothetical protein
MSPQSPPPSAAWHPDPAGSGRMRYFNGTHWTNDYADAAQPSASSPRRRGRVWRWWLLGAAPLLVVIPLGVYVVWNPFHDTHFAYSDDVQEHSRDTGVAFCVTSQSSYCVRRVRARGDSICAALRGGAAGPQEVAKVAALVSQEARASALVSQKVSEVMVYWAITDLCTDQMSKRQDQWRDGN